MPATVTMHPSARPNQTNVRRIQPNPDGGRPIDALILGFEGSFQGLIAERDDAVAIKRGLVMLRQCLDVEVTMARRLLVKDATRGTWRLQRTLHDQMRRLCDHLAARSARLTTHIIPDQQKIVSELDHHLCERSQYCDER
jgi:hypothetical protein